MAEAHGDVEQDTDMEDGVLEKLTETSAQPALSKWNVRFVLPLDPQKKRFKAGANCVGVITPAATKLFRRGVCGRRPKMSKMSS